MPPRSLPFSEIVHRLRQRPITDSATQRWDEEIRRAGLDAQPSRVMNLGVPLLAIGVLKIALLLALFEPTDGIRPIGVLLLVLAIAPWGFWLYKGDEGPHWQAVTGLLLPIAILSIGHWFAPAISMGSENAYPALGFPPLLLTILAVAIAPTRLAVGITIATWAVMGVPMSAAHIAGKDITGAELVTWHVAVALCITAGYAIRFSNQANAAVTLARETMVRREASDQQRRIARDVHDVVAHTLAITMLHITAARMAVQREDLDTAARALEEAERQGRESMTDIRSMVRILRGDDPATIGAALPEIDDLLTSWETSGMEIDASIHLPPDELTPGAQAALSRILQEALTNAARHGDGPICVRVAPDNGQVTLTVTNPHGGGHPPGAGAGITGMRERAQATGGELSARQEGESWVVRARLPQRSET